ncbi:Polyketide synthase [Metarhizium humberi]|uniref:Polyketide synthase n=1 Tax=Metarhizium humberi TaxID=2596975 RepID=A0A9P8S4E5_9HYPO|nr:Polyketide synthase [Metarhizium humberi]
MTFCAEHSEGGLRLLFGPQCSEIENSITHIRDAIIKNPTALGFLSEILNELPSIWPAITCAWPVLDQVSGEKQLAILGQLVEDGLSANNEVEATNLILTPVTVMSHIIDFWNLQHVATHSALPPSSSQDATHKVIDAQGFCVGILAAITVSCSRDIREFQALACNAIRLAVCIGALVDLDLIVSGNATSMAVRWESLQNYDHLERVLTQYPNVYISCHTNYNSVTITLPDNAAQWIQQELSGHGIVAKKIFLRGRFHHYKTHREGIQHIMKLCVKDPRFQLPCSDALLFALRSSQDGEVIKDGTMLHRVALETILSAKANWWKTVSELVNSAEMKFDGSHLLSIGSGEFVPHPARDRLLRLSSLLDGHGKQRLTNGDTSAPSAVSLPNGKRTVDISPETAHTPPLIAVTGMACRYPNADSVSELWDLLELGQCTVQTPPESRFRMSGLQREPKGPFWGHFLDRPDAFDHRFFGISAREAESMDPQQRILLQVAYEAMESAGYCGLQSTQLSRDIGCYVGVGSEDYTENVASRHANAFSATGTLQSFISGRISHYFGWSGPSITLDTACSSAAVAIHLACKALQTNECSIAVAGGVNILTNPRVYQNLSAASFLSPTGACKPFDAAADGYCRGEGAGLVVLRPLQDAIDHGDPILAVIAGSAVNQGSNSSPITVPDSESQSSLFQKALSLSGVAPEEVTYVEAHGTGTQVGDPIELESLCKVFGSPHRRGNLYVGSIKGNIGHTETSSGVAGLLKTILMLQKRQIPKQAYFRQLNPKVGALLDHNRLVIPVESMKWGSARRVAMVSNYGASGSNAALVVKDHAAGRSDQRDAAPGYLLDVPILVSAQSEASLREYCGALRTTLLSNSESGSVVWDLAYNLAIKQNRTLQFNLTFPTSSAPASLGARLEAIATGTSADMVQKRPASEPPVVLCFGGQNGTTASISRQLFDSCALLRSHLMACEQAGQTLGHGSLFPTIFASDPIADIMHLHFVLFSIQYACAKAWLDSGLNVHRIVGHSFGQLTALAVAGSLGVRDGIRLVSERARLIQAKWGPESGVMLAVDGTETAVQRILERTGHGADIACYNGPRQLVLAGTEESIQAVEEAIAANNSTHNVRVRRLENTHAFHSRLVDSIVPGLTEVAESLVYRTPAIPIEACSATGNWSIVTPAKIVEHSRMPVYFQCAVERAARHIQTPAVWLEAGSASPIIPMVRRVLEKLPGTHTYHTVDLGGPRGAANLATVTGRLWAQGIHVQFWAFHQSQRGSFGWMNLPPYQFAKARHWVDYKPEAFSQSGPSKEPQAASQQPIGLLRKLSDGSDEHLFAVNTQDALYRSCTKGHAVLDQTLCPASMYIELVLRATSCVAGGESSTPAMSHVQDLAISSPLVLDPQGQVFVRLFSEGRGPPETWSFSVTSNGQAGGDPLTHAKGTVCLYPERSRTPARFHSMGRLVDPVRARAIEEEAASSGLKGAAVYAALRQVTNYADYYRGVRQVFANDCEAAGVVSMASSAIETACNPILLDNFLQVAGIHVNCLSSRQEEEIFVCGAIGETFIDKLLINREDGAVPWLWTIYTCYERRSKNQIMCDVYVMDSRTNTMATAMIGVVFTAVSIRSLSRTLAKLNKNSSDGVDSTSILDLQPESQPAVDTTAHDRANPNEDTSKGCDAVQGMLCDLFGVGIDELSPSSSLNDIGVDSLMSTEVHSEIKKRFQVELSHATLVEIPDIQSLAKHIFQGRLQAAHPRQVVGTVLQPPAASQSADLPPVMAGDGPSLVSVAQQSFKETRAALSHTHDAHWTNFFHAVYPQQMTLITTYLVEAFCALGSSLDSCQPGEVLPTVAVLPRHERLRKQLYKILESVNLVRRTPTGQLVRTATPIPRLPSHTLHAQIRREHVPYALEHDLLQITGSRLAGCLTGQADGASLIFQNAQTRRLLEDVYTHSPVFRSGNLYLVRYLTDVIQAFGNNSRPIKILEIGAGTGGTTKGLLEQLSTLHGMARVEYTFSDISSSLIAAARKKFAKYDFVRYQTLDIENSPPSHLHGQYDIVLSTNCVHATRDLVESCSNIRALLQSKGFLCLVELTRDIFWLDLVFGLLEGWWRYEDGRDHALATEHLWDSTLHQAGFEWVDWTDNETMESNALRVIVASPSQISPTARELCTKLPSMETVVWGERDGLQLLADIYYPARVDSTPKPRPIVCSSLCSALMIHGGGHVMLSRQDIRPTQTQTLLEAGFLPISVDYRLCPEVSLPAGPMADVRDALGWVRRVLPNLPLLRPDIRPDGNRVVAVGWSTGGHLAMTLPWMAPATGIAPPDAILAFYCPTDYEDPFWSRQNFPFGQIVASNDMEYDVWEGVNSAPITGYNPPVKERPLGGWMSTSDPRSRIALHMNWTGQTLPLLLKGWMHKDKTVSDDSDPDSLPFPTYEEIQAVSPQFQIRAGRYRTPTFLIHGTMDDLVPCAQTESTYGALVANNIEAEIRVVQEGMHLFDLHPSFHAGQEAVADGYEFLKRHVHL